jgi:hypothetical protein
MKAVMHVLWMAALTILLTTGCKKPSDANDENEHEAINKLELTFRFAGQPDQIFIAEDPDGDGGLPPTRIDTIRLAAGRTYSATFRALNIVNGVIRDITPTIQAQANSHELFYLPTGGLLQIQKLDKDTRGFPLGLSTTWVSSSTGVGSVLIKLMHKTGIKGPADSPDLGHSDLELPMRVEIY